MALVVRHTRHRREDQNESVTVFRETQAADQSTWNENTHATAPHSPTFSTVGNPEDKNGNHSHKQSEGLGRVV